MEDSKTNEYMENVMPENFKSIIVDFTNDLTITFPEYEYLWNVYKNCNYEKYSELYSYCLTIYPERFFDILYQNDEIFMLENETMVDFLPNVDFKMLYSTEDISENTKKAIWKYLQLILVTIMGGIKNKASFGETMNLFDGIEESELQTKLSETINGLSDFFKNMEKSPESNNNAGDGEMPNMDEIFEKLPSMFENMGEMNEEMEDNLKKQFGEGSTSEEGDKSNSIPNPEDLHEHLKGLFDGKIGKLAKELADELSGDLMHMFGEDGEGENGPKSTQDVLKKMMKNPKKIMDLLKTVSTKLDTKMKSGDISQTELMKEASDLMGKMKSMGGGKEFENIMKNMTKNMGSMMGGGGGKKGGFNGTAFKNMMNQNQNRERMLNKLSKRKESSDKKTSNLHETDRPNEYVFKMDDGDKQEKSVKPATNEKSVDDWLCEIEGTQNKQEVNKSKSSKKSKKKK